MSSEPHLRSHSKSKSPVLCVTGPESTGKSVLSSFLAEELNALQTPEYAREYLEQLSRPYIELDLSIIARAQARLQRRAAFLSEQTVIFDTDALTLEIWSLFKYGRVARSIQEMLRVPLADAYLLCSVDLPWQDDPLREHPNRRGELFGLHLDSVIRTGKPFKIIDGIGNERFESALKAARELGFAL